MTEAESTSVDEFCVNELEISSYSAARSSFVKVSGFMLAVPYLEAGNVNAHG